MELAIVVLAVSLVMFMLALLGEWCDAFTGDDPGPLIAGALLCVVLLIGITMF